MCPDPIRPAIGRHVQAVINRMERARERGAAGCLAALLSVLATVPVVAAPIGMSATPPLITIEQTLADPEDPSDQHSDPPQSSAEDLRSLQIRSDSIEAALAHGVRAGGVPGNGAGPSTPLPSFTLRPFADPHLHTTISPSGRLSFNNGGDDLLTRGSTRFGTGEGRGGSTAQAYGLFAVFLQFEPAAGVLSGPFGNDATFTELYSALEEYDRASSQEAGIGGSLRATFP